MASSPNPPPDELTRLRLERDLFRRLLDLGARDDVVPFLEEALASIVDITGAQRGYLELCRGAARFSMARGFTDDELEGVRRELSTGIIAQALASGKTISTASAVDDPRFSAQQSVQSRRIRAVLCAPIGAGATEASGSATPTGVVYLQGRDAPGPFPDADRDHAELFARHLAPLAERLLAREVVSPTLDHTAELRTRLAVGAIAGTSRALAEVLRQLAVAAPVPVAVLVTGESGTGKTALAHALHQSSPRASKPFVELNCAAIPEPLFESELFGAEKGAHSTATRRIDGKIDAARGGTLFLDEVGEIPLGAQSKLLTFLQSRRYYRLGGTAPIEADVRVVAATNADLEERIREKRFREDLYYRLNVLEIRVPPLRERPEDIPAIAERIAHGLGETHGHALPLSRAARLALVESEWPGNVRQLENVLQRGWAVALSEKAPAIEPRHLFPVERGHDEQGDTDAHVSYQEATRRFQARFVREALEAHGWNVSETARRIGLARSHLNELIRAYGLTRAPK